MGLLAPGAVVAGCRIESVVGRGGMGVVYRALDLELGRVVALKLIAPELLENTSIRTRFLKEARTAAAIEHPNVIPVYAAGEREGSAYLVMRYVDGSDLRALVSRDGPLAPRHAAEVISRIGAGLDVIHRAGFVHRDVKPANVLVDRDGHVYVTDFGLAKAVLSRGGATATGAWVGTLDYVAPEQIRGEPLDARSDVYALGGVLHFMLTGHVPFERSGDQAKLWAQLSAPAPAPSQLRTDIPREFDAVIARAMAKEPDGRYPSAGDLGRAAVAAAAGRVPAQPERMVARGAAAPGGDTIALEPAEEGATLTAGGPRPPPPRRRRRWAAALAAAVLAAGVTAFLLVRDAPERDPPATVQVGATIDDVGHRPNGVAVANGDLWVTSSDRSQVERIDGATGRKLDPVEVGLGAASIVSAGNSVWVALTAGREVVQLDARDGTVVDHLRPGGPARRLAFGLGSLWVSTSGRPGGDQLVRFDADGRQLGHWPMPHGVTALATSADAVWIAERDVPDVLRFDPRTGKSKPWASLAGPATFLAYGSGHLWATIQTANLIARVDPREAGATPVSTDAGSRPQQVVVARGRVFVAVSADHSVQMFDPRTGRKQGAPLEVAHNPFALAAAAQAVWVTGITENTLTPITYR